MLTIAIVSTVKSVADVFFMLLAIPRRIRRAAAVGALHAAPPSELDTADHHNTKYIMNVEEPEWTIEEETSLRPHTKGTAAPRHDSTMEDDPFKDGEELIHVTTMPKLTMNAEEDEDDEKLKKGLRRFASSKGIEREEKHQSFRRTPSFAPPPVMSASGGRRKVLNFGGKRPANDATATNVAPEVPPRPRRIDFIDLDNESIPVHEKHEVAQPLRRVDSSVVGEKDRAHLTKHAKMLLRVDSKKAIRRDGFATHVSSTEEALEVMYRDLSTAVAVDDIGEVIL